MPEVTSIQKASWEFKSLNYSEKDILDYTVCTWNIHLDRWAQSLHTEPWLACGHSPRVCDSSDASSHKCLSWPSVLGCRLLYLWETLAGRGVEIEVIRCLLSALSFLLQQILPIQEPFSFQYIRETVLSLKPQGSPWAVPSPDIAS